MRHTPRTVVALLAVLLLTACPDRRDGAAGTGHAAEEVPATDRPAATSLPDLLASVYDRAPDGTLPVLGRLPAPDEVRKEPVRNRHDPALTDTVVTRIHPGLRVEVYRVTASGKEIVRSIEVIGEQYRTPEGIGPGSTRAEVITALGPPASVDGSTLEYRITRGERDPTPTHLTVRLLDDVVQRMTWDYYVD